MSASGHSFTYRDVDFGGENYGVYVVGKTYPQMPRPRVNIDEFAQGDGGVMQGSTFGHRRIALECKLVASTLENRAIQIDNVVTALVLSQTNGAADLAIDLFPGKLFTGARLVSDITVNLSARMETFTLEFVCDPWPSAVEVTEGSGNNSGTGTTTL
jgi:hypothetical protein